MTETETVEPTKEVRQSTEVHDSDFQRDDKDDQ